MVHSVPEFIWRISKRAERPVRPPWRKSYVYLRFRSYFRTGHRPGLFPFLSPFLALSRPLAPLSSDRSLSLSCDFSLPRSHRPSSLFVSYSVFRFCRAMPFSCCSFLVLSQLSTSFLASPFASLFLSRAKDFIRASSSSHLRIRFFARSLLAPAISHLFIQPLFLRPSFSSRSYTKLSIRFSLFLRFSPQPFLASRNRQTFQRIVLHYTPVKRRVIVKRLYSLV